jgi:hypothetical protein
MTDTFGCIGTHIKTDDLGYIDLADPRPELIHVRTIGRALSRLCRYGGHCPGFYSVAEHSVRCLQLAEVDGQPRGCLRAVLMHDAAEAYLGDVVKPLKSILPDYARIESRMELVIQEALGVDFALYEDAIGYYDRVVLKVERTSFWPPDGVEWPGLVDIPDAFVSIEFLQPEAACRLFLQKALQLGFYTGESE